MRTLRHGGEMAVLMLDIDFFKAVNDRHSHQAGDPVLQSLSRICQQNIRSIDLAGRLGGEEFAIFLPETGPGRALDVAERLRTGHPMPIARGEPIPITVSIGVASLHADQADLHALLQTADSALYAAKAARRNRICLGDSAPSVR